jgi:hypothetical protein
MVDPIDPAFRDYVAGTKFLFQKSPVLSGLPDSAKHNKALEKDAAAYDQVAIQLLS